MTSKLEQPSASSSDDRGGNPELGVLVSETYAALHGGCDSAHHVLRSLADRAYALGAKAEAERAYADRLHQLEMDRRAADRVERDERAGGGDEKAGWKCEVCQNCGTIRFDRAGSIYDKINLVAFAHTDASEGRCEGGISRLKLWPIPAAASSSVARGDT